jgi:hypothetical protein
MTYLVSNYVAQVSPSCRRREVDGGINVALDGARPYTPAMPVVGRGRGDAAGSKEGATSRGRGGQVSGLLEPAGRAPTACSSRHGVGEGSRPQRRKRRAKGGGAMEAPAAADAKWGSECHSILFLFFRNCICKSKLWAGP